MTASDRDFYRACVRLVRESPIHQQPDGSLLVVIPWRLYTLIEQLVDEQQKADKRAAATQTGTTTRPAPGLASGHARTIRIASDRRLEIVGSPETEDHPV